MTRGCISSSPSRSAARWRDLPAVSLSPGAIIVSPPVFSVVQSAQIIIWLMVGGAGTLLGPVIGAMAISWLTVKIGTQQIVNANVVLGAHSACFRPAGAAGASRRW